MASMIHEVVAHQEFEAMSSRSVIWPRPCIAGSNRSRLSSSFAMLCYIIHAYIYLSIVHSSNLRVLVMYIYDLKSELPPQSACSGDENAFDSQNLVLRFSYTRGKRDTHPRHGHAE